MKSPKKPRDGFNTTKLQFASALTETATDPDPLRPVVRLQNFRVPWTSPKPPARPPVSVESAPASADRPAPMPLPPAGLTARTSSAAPGDTVLAPNLEAAFEEIRYRLETKTALLEEALRRFERSEYRFWGINE
jgi:hypothetical protein